MGIRRWYSAECKVEVVLEMLKEAKSISPLSSEYGIHHSQLIRRRQQVIQGFPAVMSDQKRAIVQMKAQYEDKLRSCMPRWGV